MSSTDKSKVEFFLEEFLQCWPPQHFVVPRPENRDALLDLDLTAYIRQEIIYNLKAENYVEGPKPDDNLKGEEIWEFGTKYDGIDIYIKLQVQKKGPKFAKCISFHRAKYEIIYKFTKS